MTETDGFEWRVGSRKGESSGRYWHLGGTGRKDLWNREIMARKGEGKWRDNGDMKTIGRNSFKTKKRYRTVSVMSKFYCECKG